MNLKSLVPWSSPGRGNAAMRYSDDNSVSSVHREMTRLFDGFFRGIDEPLLGPGQFGWPHAQGVQDRVVAALTSGLPL